MGEDKKFEIHRNSSHLWQQLSEMGVYPQIKSQLEVLDRYQEEESISPFLADTVRDVIFQAVVESPDFVNELVVKSFGIGVKFIVTKLEDHGFRIRKSAELVVKGKEDYVNVGDVMLEYINWQSSYEDDGDA